MDDFDNSVKDDNPEEGEKKTEPKEKPAEEKSLMELIGADAADSEEAPERVDHREDEAGSGMVKLTNLVADSSPAQSDAPSVARTSVDSAASAAATSAAATVGSASLPTAQKGKTSPAVKVVIGVVVVVAAAVAVVVFIAKMEPSAEELVRDSQIASLKAELEKMKEIPKVEDEKPEVEEKPAPVQEPPAEQEPDAGDEQLEEQAEPEPKIKPAATKIARSKPAGAKKAAISSVPLKETPMPKEEAPVKKATKSGDPLDALLNADKSGIPEKKRSATVNLPNTLSRADVKKVMSRVAANAKQKCSKYGTGTVQLQVLVGSNGRVRESKAKGNLANTTAGKCVEMLARTAKFPQFKEPVARVAYPITLQ